MFHLSYDRIIKVTTSFELIEHLTCEIWNVTHVISTVVHMLACPYNNDTYYMVLHLYTISHKSTHGNTRSQTHNSTHSDTHIIHDMHTIYVNIHATTASLPSICSCLLFTAFCNPLIKFLAAVAAATFFATSFSRVNRSRSWCKRRSFSSTRR